MKLVVSCARGRQWLAALTCTSACACGGAEPSPSDVVESDDGRSFADTVLMLISVKDESAPEVRYLDPNHVHRVALAIDGQPWGVYTVTPADATPDTYRYLEEPREKLMVAQLSEREDLENLELATTENWVDFLVQHLSPGDHVAEIESVVLRAGDDEVEIDFDGLLPFEIADGEESALIGAVELSTPIAEAP